MSRLTHPCVISLIFVLSLPVRAHGTQSNPAPSDLSAQAPAIVIGFVGGFVSRDDTVHSEVQLAQRLRRRYPVGVDAEVFENRHVKEARRRILALLTAGSHGVLSSDEKRNARIVLYGHSWGAAAVVRLARALQKDGIPVLLTVQVDAISKYAKSDVSTIPSNVLEAANFYQTHGLIHGAREIRAQDPSRTHILGNFRLDYTHSNLRCSNYPWWDRYLLKAHTQIECDPAVWDKVYSLITGALPGAQGESQADVQILPAP